MVRIVLLNLLRSKYGIAAVEVPAGTVEAALDRLVSIHPEVRKDDFRDAVLFVNDVQVVRVDRLKTQLQDGDVVVFTHFVGGG